MIWTRRDLKYLIPALAAGSAAGQSKALASKSYRYEDLTARSNGQNRSLPVLNGATHSGFPVELHETELGPSQEPHPPHHHAHEEMIMIREGMLDVTIAGNTTRLGPGSVAYVASNEEHGWRNAGTDRAKYFVLALGRDKP
jgi:quercetin dioxygenase-like cupin family protein